MVKEGVCNYEYQNKRTFLYKRPTIKRIFYYNTSQLVMGI